MTPDSPAFPSDAVLTGETPPRLAAHDREIKRLVERHPGLTAVELFRTADNRTPYGSLNAWLREAALRGVIRAEPPVPLSGRIPNRPHRRYFPIEVRNGTD